MVCLLLIVVSCKQSAKEPYFTVGAQASWAKYYASLSELTPDSELIAVGVIDQVIRTFEEAKNLYATTFSFRIEQVLKGEEIDKVNLLQTGASEKPWTIITDDPLFQKGERYLLFLDHPSPDIYVTLSGPFGRYQIMDNKVYSMNHILQNNQYSAPQGLDFNGVSLADVLNEVTENLNSVRFNFSAQIIRLLSGEVAKYDVVLSTGQYGEGEITYAIRRVESNSSDTTLKTPEGMWLNIIPAAFSASPYIDYRSVIEIRTDEQVISPGEYYFILSYVNDSQTIKGVQRFTVVIEAMKVSEIKTRPN